MPEPSETRQANERVPKKSSLGKYKWYLVGGLALIAVLVFYFVNKSKSASGAAGTSNAAAMGIDPATGLPYAQEYASTYGQGMGFNPYGGGGPGGGFTGPAGPQGPIGKTGPAGPKGPKGSGPKGKGKDPDHKHHKKGSRTEALTNAVAARREWNTRIIPSPIRHTHYV